MWHGREVRGHALVENAIDHGTVIGRGRIDKHWHGHGTGTRPPVPGEGAKDMPWPLKVQVHSDATAGIGISKRRGIGKIRHQTTADRWVQEQVRTGADELLKVLGTENPADCFTKDLSKQCMDKKRH